ncbi:MAG: CPBP family glutamic-type intramembrane protease, partial [Candidatus Hodarchaeales archaeon]
MYSERLNSKEFRELLIIYTFTVVVFSFLFTDKTISFWLKYCAVNIGLLIVAIILDGERIKEKLMRGMRDWKQSSWRAVVWAFAVFFVLWILHFLGFIGIVSYPELLSEINQLLAPEDTLFLLITMITIVGPCEEIFWRGFFQERIEELQNYQKGEGLLLTSLLYAFTVISKGNLLLFTGLFLVSLFWGFLYSKNRIIVD